MGEIHLGDFNAATDKAGLNNKNIKTILTAGAGYIILKK